MDIKHWKSNQFSFVRKYWSEVVGRSSLSLGFFLTVRYSSSWTSLKFSILIHNCLFFQTEATLVHKSSIQNFYAIYYKSLVTRTHVVPFFLNNVNSLFDANVGYIKIEVGVWIEMVVIKEHVLYSQFAEEVHTFGASRWWSRYSWRL